MPSKKTKTAIESGGIYHIYNRGNNHQEVFFEKGDYLLFLEKFRKYLSGYCSLYAFALLPNHYHFLLRVNPEITGAEFSSQYSKFKLSYTNTVNFRLKRDGSLFLSVFRRIKVEKDDYLRHLVFYINHNPVNHKIVENLTDYKYSSYSILISEKPTILNRKEVHAWFGGLKGFIEFHKFLYNNNLPNELHLEDV